MGVIGDCQNRFYHKIIGVLVFRGDHDNRTRVLRSNQLQRRGVDGRAAATNDARVFGVAQARTNFILHLHLLFHGQNGDRRVDLVQIRLNKL